MAQRVTLSTFRWSDDAVIRRVDVREQTDGRAVAYLYANEGEDAQEQRKEIRAAIRLKGWGTLSDHRDGGYALRVSGLSSAAEFIDMLKAGGFVQGEPQVTRTTPQAAASKNLWDSIRNNSLQVSGVIATVGNAMSIASGVHRGKGFGQIGQGAAFAVADLPLAIAGERDDSRQLNNLLRELKKHYETTGIEIPKNASIHAETSDRGKGFGELAMDYMHRYANQIKCSLEVVAAAFTIRAGFEQKSTPKKLFPLVWGSGFLASLLISEKKIDDEKYAQAGAMDRLWMKIQSNPLSVGGLLGYSNNIASYMSAYNERKASLAPGGNGRHFYRWDFAIPTVMLGANGTYAMSKKTVGGDIRDDAMVSDVYIIAAQILNKQPEGPLRDAAIESTAKFLADRTEIKDKRPEIIRRLHEEMQVQRESPWFEKRGLPNYTPQPKKARFKEKTAESTGSPASTIQGPATAHVMPQAPELQVH